MLKKPAFLGFALALSLIAGPAWADDDDYHHHGDGGLNHFFHDYGIPHSHGFAGDAHEYNHYLHDNGIPHVHTYPQQCYRVIDHDQYGRHVYREVCE